VVLTEEEITGPEYISALSEILLLGEYVTGGSSFEAGSEDVLVGTERFWSGDMSSAEGRSADESASESILVVSSAGTEECSDRLSVEVSLADNSSVDRCSMEGGPVEGLVTVVERGTGSEEIISEGTETGPEILTGTETGPENLSSAGSVVGDNLFLVRIRVELL